MKSIKTVTAMFLLSLATGCSSLDVVTDTGASNVNVAVNDYRGDLETDPIMRSMASDSRGE